MKTLKQTKKITLATLKAFAKRNEGKIYAKKVSSFDGMIDGVVQSTNAIWKETEISTELTGFFQTGIRGIYTVGSSRDCFTHYENEEYEGIKVSNCCGVTILAVKKLTEKKELLPSASKIIKASTHPDRQLNISEQSAFHTGAEYVKTQIRNAMNETEHPYNLAEKGRQFDKVKEQRDECVKVLKECISLLEVQLLIPMGGVDPYKQERLTVKHAEKAIKSTE